MAVAHQFCPLKQQVYATLSPEERELAQSLLHVNPNYRYDRSGLPKLDPTPAAGLASAVAAAKVLAAWVKFAMRHRAASGRPADLNRPPAPQRATSKTVR
jgi:hypothetical protein